MTTAGIQPVDALGVLIASLAPSLFPSTSCWCLPRLIGECLAKKKAHWLADAPESLSLEVTLTSNSKFREFPLRRDS